MKRVLERQLCLYARSFLLSPPLRPSSNPTPLLAILTVPSRLQLSFYSSKNESFSEPSLSGGTHKKDLPSELEDVTDEELKRRIEKYYEGDGEALPSLFEAILIRKLSGKHEEADNELMNEIRRQMPRKLEDADDDLVINPDLDELDETEDGSESEDWDFDEGDTHKRDDTFTKNVLCDSTA